MTFPVDQPNRVNPLAAQKDQLLQRAGQGSSVSRENAKVVKAGKDFESILLGNWLQQAENSFAKVPGGDDQDSDPGKDQFQGMAMQALAGSLTASGGIGLARMITRHLLAKDKEATEASKSAAEQTVHANATAAKGTFAPGR